MGSAKRLTEVLVSPAKTYIRCLRRAGLSRRWGGIDVTKHSFSLSATCAESLDPASSYSQRSGKKHHFHPGICLAASLLSVIIEGGSDMRNLLNRCGDRELLWALMAVVGAIVFAITS